MNEHIQVLEECWTRNNEDSIEDNQDIYFDCFEEFEDMSIYYPWIWEISLSVHRKTNIFRRFLNSFNRSNRSTLPNLAKEFVRIYNGHFKHSIGDHFHLSYAKEKWLLILKDIKYKYYSTYPYPSTRIILIRKKISYIAK